MKKRILKTLEDSLMINRAFMEEEDIKDLEEQIDAVKASIAGETDVQIGRNGNKSIIETIMSIWK